MLWDELLKYCPIFKQCKCQEIAQVTAAITLQFGQQLLLIHLFGDLLDPKTAVSLAGIHHTMPNNVNRTNFVARRRKVRCNEQRPRCSNCERLNFECKWRQPHNAALVTRQRQSLSASMASSSNSLVTSNPNLDSHMALTRDYPQVSTSLSPEAVDQVFDYASFMWDTADLWQHQQQLASDGNIDIHPGTQHPLSTVCNL
jgi:hypothetical protein